METSFLLIEGGNPRLPSQPRGYYLDIIEDNKRRSLFCYSVIMEENKFVIYHNVGRGMPSNCSESENISDALRFAFERVNKNAKILAKSAKLEYKLLRDSEFLPENLENVRLI